MKYSAVAVALGVIVSSFVVKMFYEDWIYEMIYGDGATAVIYSIMGSIAVGLTGVVPLFWIPSSEEERKKKGRFINLASSFAAGALLGDVFLHILPESWNVAYENQEKIHQHAVWNGVLILVGIISFLILEKLLEYAEMKLEKADLPENVDPVNVNGNNNVNKKATEKEMNGDVDKNRQALDSETKMRQEDARNKAAGVLNLVANSLDNFTHGLAIGGSFLVSPQFGLISTGLILLHEIPHEVGDFALLLKAGWGPKTAAKLQILTALVGPLGAFSAHIIDPTMVWWILPFTAGGFLHIALCSIIPGLMRETSSITESIFQFCFFVSGVILMGIIGVLV